MERRAAQGATVIQEVDARNLEAMRPQCEAAFRQATFIAFDCEFTGLYRERQQGSGALQSMRAKYANLRQHMFGGSRYNGRCDACRADLIESAGFCHNCGKQVKQDRKRLPDTVSRQQDFIICQVGLACFTHTESGYGVKVFSFYISPKPIATGPGGSGNVKVDHDIRFGAMGSSIKFLSDHGFDFNRWINDGIPFLSRAAYRQEKERRARRGQSMAGLEEGKGFLDIWDSLLAAGKPLVGHQCLYDILNLCNQFEGPLDASLPGMFANYIRKVKVTVDTKHLLTWYPRNLAERLKERALEIDVQYTKSLKERLDRTMQQKTERTPQSPAVASDLPVAAAPAAAPASAAASAPAAASTAAAPGAPAQAGAPAAAAGNARTRVKSPAPSATNARLLENMEELRWQYRKKANSWARADLGDPDADAKWVGNKFAANQLSDTHKALYGLVEELLPPPPPAREHDAGYDAWLTGTVFLALFGAIHLDLENAVVPNTETLLKYHSQPDGRRYPDPKANSPSTFAFVNRLFVFAAPFFYDLAGKPLEMTESHSHTFEVEREEVKGQRLETNAILQVLHKVDPWADVYWIDYQRSAVVFISGLGKERTCAECTPDEVLRVIAPLLARPPLNFKTTSVLSSLAAAAKLKPVKKVATSPQAGPGRAGPVLSGGPRSSLPVATGPMSLRVTGGKGAPAAAPASLSPADARQPAGQQPAQGANQGLGARWAQAAAGPSTAAGAAAPAAARAPATPGTPVLPSPSGAARGPAAAGADSSSAARGTAAAAAQPAAATAGRPQPGGAGRVASTTPPLPPRTALQQRPAPASPRGPPPQAGARVQAPAARAGATGTAMKPLAGLGGLEPPPPPVRRIAAAAPGAKPAPRKRVLLPAPAPFAAAPPAPQRRVVSSANAPPVPHSPPAAALRHVAPPGPSDAAEPPAKRQRSVLAPPQQPMGAAGPR